MIAELPVMMLAVEYPLDGEDVVLCGPAQEVWTLLREENGWWKENATFDHNNSTFILWWRHGAMKLYIEPHPLELIGG